MSGLAIIGYFIWWTIQGVKVSRDDFRNLLKKFGIDYDMGNDAEKEVSLRRSAFLKAVREVKASGKKFLIRKIRKVRDQYTFGLVDESIRESDLEYQHKATLKFNPETGSLDCDFSHRAYEAIKLKYAEYQGTLDSNDVRAVLLEIISKHHRVGVRDRGGIYFLPEAKKDLVQKLEALVADLPGGASYLSVAPQVDVDQSKKAIYKAFMTSLTEKISAFRNELTDDTLSRKSAMKTRLDEYKTLKDEVEFYAEALSFQVDGLRTELNNLTEDMQKKLME